MADRKHVELLLRGTDAWNQWRHEHPHVQPNLAGGDLTGAILTGSYLVEADLGGASLGGASLGGADLSQANLGGADLRKADLAKANLTAANLREANLANARLPKATLTGADLSEANLREADLRGTDLREANLKEANLAGAYITVANLSRARLLKANLFKANLSVSDLRAANLSGADLSGANLTGADLSGAKLKLAQMVNTNLERANLTGCNVYGISAWGVNLRDTRQQDLVITDASRSLVAVDNLEVAQFISLVLNSEGVQEIIKTLMTKAVLVLGHFGQKREPVLQALRKELRDRGYRPILFQCDKPVSSATHESIVKLGRICRFIVADLTEGKNVLHELYSAAPAVARIPIMAFIPEPDYEPGLVNFFRIYPWFLNVHRYRNQEELLETLGEAIIAPAEKRAKELRRRASPR